MTAYKPNFKNPGLPTNQRTFLRVRMVVNEEGIRVPQVTKVMIPKVAIGGNAKKKGNGGR